MKRKPSLKSMRHNNQLMDRGRGSFETVTPPGTSRFEWQKMGPLRPGKTEQDFMPPSERPRVIAAKARVQMPNHLRGDRAAAVDGRAA